MDTAAVHTFGTSAFARLGDGRKLHYMIRGSGSPTVVFESGMGASRSTWGLVQPAVAAHARAVVYDRAGTGRSDADAAPRTLARMAGDLVRSLDELGEGPFVLVGHSWGGPIVRKAAAMLLASDPSRLSGLVLVDPSDEHADLYFSPSTAKYYAWMRRLLPTMARLRLNRLMSGGIGKCQPSDVVRDHLKEDFTVQAARAAAAELAPMLDELAELRRQSVGLGDLPVTVISGGLLSWQEKKYRPIMMAAHRQTAAALANGRWVEAPNSGHMIMYTEPGLIVDEVLRMIRVR